MAKADETVWRLAMGAWRNTFAAMRAMPVLTLSAFALLLAVYIAAQWLGVPFMPPAEVAILDRGPGLLRQLVVTAVVASLVIAVHRAVLLGEVVDRPVLAPAADLSALPAAAVRRSDPLDAGRVGARGGPVGRLDLARHRPSASSAGLPSL